MAKYIFQDGGENPAQQQPLVVQSDSGISFNNYLDSLMQQQVPQQPQMQQPNDAQSAPEESDYIKGLRAQAEEDANKPVSYDEHLATIEKRINDLSASLGERQTQVDWFGSDDGYDYARSAYDKDSTNPVFNHPPMPADISHEISSHYANKRNLDNMLTQQQLQQRQMMAESGGNNNAVSKAGARGPYQFMPATWDAYKPSPDAQITDPVASGKAYNKYMGELLTQFGGDQRKAVAAYNAGDGRISSAIKQYGDDWENHIPAETKGYLKNVFDNNIQTAHNANLTGIKPELLDIVGTLSKTFNGLKVTSGTDGQHMNNSAHYDGEAVDIGANSSNKEAYQKFVQSLPDLKEKYGIKYIDEGDHIHISLSSHGKT